MDSGAYLQGLQQRSMYHVSFTVADIRRNIFEPKSRSCRIQCTNPIFLTYIGSQSYIVYKLHKGSRIFATMTRRIIVSNFVSAKHYH